MNSAQVGPDSVLEAGPPWRRRLHAVVLDPDGGTARHYWRDLDRPDRWWQRGEALPAAVTGPGRLDREGGAVVARVRTADGVRSFRLAVGGARMGPLKRWLSLSKPRADTKPANPGTWVPAPDRPGTPSPVQRPHRLVDEEGSIYHEVLRAPAAGWPGGWWRVGCLRVVEEPAVRLPQESVRIAQVSGETDPQPTPWGERRPTLGRSLSTAGIRGTDLGVRVDTGGRSLLLCGDTHWQRRPWLATRDAIAEVLGDGPDGLPRVRFHGSPLRLRGGGATSREYDVPLDAFSHAGRLYACFSSNHFRNARVMGRSVLARAVDPAFAIDPAARHRPVDFTVLGTFSAGEFVNVSVHHDGDTLWLWGSGPYRAGHLRLARLDLAASGLAGLRPAAGRRTGVAAALGVRYWNPAGWRTDEADAAPLLRGAWGEVSVRWVPELGRYLLLGTTGPEDADGPAVMLRTATDPWGPWSGRLRLLDWLTSGRSADRFTRFLHTAADDGLGDRVFRAQARALGAAYAPYLFDARVEGDDLVLRYTLSTWNPYQVALLRHRVALADLAAAAPEGPLPAPPR
jgi:hypothetical protein